MLPKESKKYKNISNSDSDSDSGGMTIFDSDSDSDSGGWTSFDSDSDSDSRRKPPTPDSRLPTPTPTPKPWFNPINFKLDWKSDYDFPP